MIASELTRDAPSDDNDRCIAVLLVFHTHLRPRKFPHDTKKRVTEDKIPLQNRSSRDPQVFKVLEIGRELKYSSGSREQSQTQYFTKIIIHMKSYGSAESKFGENSTATSPIRIPRFPRAVVKASESTHATWNRQCYPPTLRNPGNTLH